MKILQLCNKPPYPPTDGGALAMNSITQGLLSMGCEVKVLAICSDKHPVRQHLLTDDYLENTQFESVYIDLDPHVIDASVAALCGESYHVKRYISSAFTAKLIDILTHQEFDIVQLEGLYLTPYVETIRKHSQAHIVMRAHNVEHHIWKQLASSCKNPLRRSYLKHLSLTLRAYEIEHINDYDGIACITKQDAQYFKNAGCRRPIVSIPFAVTPEPLDNVSEEPATLFHIGSMDWLPNQQSIDWLLNDIWPVIHKEVAKARLYLAGRHMTKDLMERHIDGVSIVGEVPDAMYFIGSKQINIVPLRSGSGIRVKIIEAMSAGKTVISTTVGAEGIDYTDGENILIANTPEEFAHHVKHCIENPDFCHQIGRNAYNLIATEYDSKHLTDKLINFYQRLCLHE
ncbi:MAG: glycosyltransferase [Bacteroidales bacterium]|nr:glycosyltransferase [Candidatus Colimorpha onthohippi]